MEGLGKASKINIKAENANGTSPENVLKSAREKQRLFTDKGIVRIYCLFDKDDCEDNKFNKIVVQCRKAGFIPAISVPCYEYWLLLHLKRTGQPFSSAHECCEAFKNEYNHKFQTDYNIKELKAKKDIFNDLEDCLATAINNAETLNLEENGTPYTNMHKVVESILNPA